jgi:SAM-dependent methyltransferase
MNEDAANPEPLFDTVAENYDEELEAGISVSGENREFFAQNRVGLLARRLRALAFQARHILDFGCGTGTTTPFLLELPGAERLTGLDLSPNSVAIAKQSYANDRTHFDLVDNFEAEGTVDLIYINGVFHHIAPADRPDIAARLARMLRPGGILAFWENNPWNPGTKYVMRRISFDRDAITLSSVEGSRLLRNAGFRILKKDFAFVFPRSLSWFRAIEPMLSPLPLGAQYQILGRKEM